MRSNKPLAGVPFFVVLCFLIGFLLFASTEGNAQPADPTQTPSIKFEGGIDSTVRYALGNGRLISQHGYSSGFFFNLAYHFIVDGEWAIDGPTPGNLTLLAALDSSQPDFLQSVAMGWDAGFWRADYGDFPMGREGSPFAYSSRLLKGFKLEWDINDWAKLTGIHSQVSGNLETRTYRGSTVESTLNYSFYPENQPFLDKPYGTNMAGLDYFALGPSFVEGFSEVVFTFNDTPGLRSILEEHELGYLYDSISADPDSDLDSAISYSIIPSGSDYFLALDVDYLSILRERLFETIDEYNVIEALTGEERKDYPFNQDTAFELEFLERLSLQTQIEVDAQVFTTRDIERNRFYSLYVVDVQEETVLVEVKVDDEYLEIEDPSLLEYETIIYPEIGFIELNFPVEYFENRDSAVRISFSYDQSGSGFYVLGLTVLKDSEKVYLNDQILQNGVDYLIEYSEGVLILITPLGEEDELRIEYETARGGLLGFSEFGRTFQGLTLHLEPSEFLELDIDLLQAHDSLISDLDQEILETMPNTHTVLGISGLFTLADLQGSFDVGISQNRFPPDKNRRENQLNAVHVIKAIEHDGWNLLLIGHRNGLHVFDGVSWTEYGIQEGLSGQEVLDIAKYENQLIFATTSGLTILELNPGNPVRSFARIRNWNTVDERDGVPASRVNAVAVLNDYIWVGTDFALGQVLMQEITDVERWRYYETDDYEQMLSNRVLELEPSEGRLFVGTDNGLAFLNPTTGIFFPILELEGHSINDLAAEGTMVYAATDQGIRVLESGFGIGWPVSDQEVNALGILNGELWYGTDRGLYGVDSGRARVTADRIITAVAGDGDSIWASEVSNDEYELFVYDVTTPSDFRLYQDVETHLSGRTDNRFRDPLTSEDRSDLGLIGRFVLRKSVGELQLEGTLEGVTPEFSPVGTLNRQDHVRLNFRGSYPIGTSIVMLGTHEEGLFDRNDTPSVNISDAIKFTYAPQGDGPNITLDSTLRKVDRDFEEPGFSQESRSISLNASHSLLEKKLNINLGYTFSDTKDVVRPIYSVTRSELSSNVRYQILPGLTTRAGYRLPIQWRFGQFSGDHDIDWQLNWIRNYPIIDFPLDVTLEYRGSTNLPFSNAGQGGSSLTQNGNISFSSSNLRLGDLRLGPQLSFSGGVTDPFGNSTTLLLSGESNLSASLFGFDGDVRYKKSYTSHGRSQLTQYSDTLSARVNYFGFTEIDPTLSFSGNLDTLLHPFFGEKTTGRYNIGLQFYWQSPGPLSADLTLQREFSANENDQLIVYSLFQNLQYAFAPWLTPRLAMNFSYTQGVDFGEAIDMISGDVSINGDVLLKGGLNGRFASVFLFNLDGLSPQDSSTGFVLEFSLGTEFTAEDLINSSQP